MNAFGELRHSFAGWTEIVVGRPDAARHFVASRAGLSVAVGWFVVAILLSLVVQSVVVGVPPTTQLLFGIMAELVTLALLGLGIGQALRWLKAEAPLLALLVPITYLLAYMFVVSIPLQLLSTVLGIVVLGLVAGDEARRAPGYARIAEAMRAVVTDPALDDLMRGELMILPGHAYLAELVAVVDPGKLHAEREALKRVYRALNEARIPFASNAVTVRGGDQGVQAGAAAAISTVPPPTPLAPAAG